MSYILIIFKSLLDRKRYCDKYVVLQQVYFSFYKSPLPSVSLTEQANLCSLPIAAPAQRTYLLHCYLEAWTSSSGPSIHYKQKKIYRFHKNIKTDDTE